MATAVSNYLSLFLPPQSAHLLPEAVTPDLGARARTLTHPGVVALVTGGGAGGAPGPGPGQGHLASLQVSVRVTVVRSKTQAAPPTTLRPSLLRGASQRPCLVFVIYIKVIGNCVDRCEMQ